MKSAQTYETEARKAAIDNGIDSDDLDTINAFCVGYLGAECANAHKEIDRLERLIDHLNTYVPEMHRRHP